MDTQTKTPTLLSRCSLAEAMKREKLSFFEFPHFGWLNIINLYNIRIRFKFKPTFFHPFFDFFFP